MIVSIHQPDFFPYPGFFNKIFLSDVFVILDRAQFEFGITNRNKIITTDGSWSRISVPVKKNQKFFQINDVKINNDINWQEKNLELISKSYKNANFYNSYFSSISSIFYNNWESLMGLNLKILKTVIEWLNIKTKILFESDLDVKGKSSKRLVNICKEVNATTYLSGIGGKNYLDEKIFQENKININYQEYSPISYPQINSKTFIPNLSILDLLFNMGSKSENFIS
tara:strand:- start:1330 stop:2007 length:678 start_codon:yes stop_codon:yes gene_type:complete